jgi:hypothetical protein
MAFNPGTAKTPKRSWLGAFILHALRRCFGGTEPPVALSEQPAKTTLFAGGNGANVRKKRRRRLFSN